jgi:hypothetical protein
MRELGFRFDILTGRFAEDMAAMEAPIAHAATSAMDGVLNIVKLDGRASIAGAGFSKRWQNTLRLQRYPKVDSMEPAVFVWHKIPYAGVFEDGATIQGKPMLWLPLSGTPAKAGRNGAKLTPERYATEIGDLVSFRSKSGRPLLGARVRVSSNRDLTKPSLSLLRRQHNYGGKGVLKTIPLFVGIERTEIHKKFSIREVCAIARNRIPALYAANFQGR